MYLLSDIKFLIKQNVWISGGLLASGVILLKLSDSAVSINLIRRLLPSFSYNFIENSIMLVGLIALFSSFYTFAVWITASNEKRGAKREVAMRQAAEKMGWKFSEYLPTILRPHIDSFMVNRTLAIPVYLHGSSQSTANFLSTEIDGDLIIIFDCVITSVNSQSESSAEFETVYMVVSGKLNLPYFQTQTESWLGDNAVAGYLKKQAGVNDLEFPQRPEFSRKYIVDAKPSDAAQIFTPLVFDLYEQNQLYRTIGDGKILCLITWQSEPFEQNQLNANLQTLQRLFQFLKTIREDNR